MITDHCKSCGTPMRLDGDRWVHYRDNGCKVQPATTDAALLATDIAAYRSPGDFGSDWFVFGEAKTRYNGLNGVRVFSPEFNELGTIYLCLVNISDRIVQIWWNRDMGGAHCSRPHSLRRVDGSELLITDGSELTKGSTPC